MNARLNDEFQKFYPSLNKQPIVRDIEQQRYWIQEDLLTVAVRGKDGKQRQHNIARVLLEIIDAYVAAKKQAFEAFIESCQQIAALAAGDLNEAVSFVEAQLRPEIDARIFEIVSFAVLKAFYGEQHIYWGWSRKTIREENLTLFKTGRTNANDGGIDFVMRPLGRFFQVTETVDVSKYFLDIDKIQRFPLTFVVKSNDSVSEIEQAIKTQAKVRYKIEAVVAGYMQAIEEIINIPRLLDCLKTVIAASGIKRVMDEIVTQSKVEFNYRSDVDNE